jgi:hypothetical protein
MSNTNKHSQQETTQELKFLISPYFSEGEAIGHFMKLMGDVKVSKSSSTKNKQRQIIFQVTTAFRRENSRVMRMLERGQFQDIYQMEFKYINYQYKTLKDFKEVRERLSVENKVEGGSYPEPDIDISMGELEELSERRKQSFIARQIMYTQDKQDFLEGKFEISSGGVGNVYN